MKDFQIYYDSYKPFGSILLKVTLSITEQPWEYINPCCYSITICILLHSHVMIIVGYIVHTDWSCCICQSNFYSEQLDNHRSNNRMWSVSVTDSLHGFYRDSQTSPNMPIFCILYRNSILYYPAPSQSPIHRQNFDVTAITWFLIFPKSCQPKNGQHFMDSQAKLWPIVESSLQTHESVCEGLCC